MVVPIQRCSRCFSDGTTHFPWAVLFPIHLQALQKSGYHYPHSAPEEQLEEIWAWRNQLRVLRRSGLLAASLKVLGWKWCFCHCWFFIHLLRRCVISLLCKLNCKILYWVTAGLGWVIEMSQISEGRAENNSCSADTLWIWNLMPWHFPGKVSQPSFIVVSVISRGIAHELRSAATPPGLRVCIDVCTYMNLF